MCVTITLQTVVRTKKENYRFIRKTAGALNLDGETRKGLCKNVIPEVGLEILVGIRIANTVGMEIFHVCAIQHGSYKPQVTMEPLKCV